MDGRAVALLRKGDKFGTQICAGGWDRRGYGFLNEMRSSIILAVRSIHTL